MDLVKKRPGYWDNAESHLCAVGPVVHALLVFDSPEEAAEFIDQVARQVAQFAKQTAPPASPEAAQNGAAGQPGSGPNRARKKP